MNDDIKSAAARAKHHVRVKMQELLAEQMRATVDAAVAMLDFAKLAGEVLDNADLTDSDSINEAANETLNRIEWEFHMSAE